jgi:hypothetical protein
MREHCVRTCNACSYYGKGVAGVPSMTIKDMSIGYGHVCDEHNGRYQKYQKPS